MSRPKIYGMNFEEAVNFVEEQELQKNTRESQGEGMEIVVSITEWPRGEVWDRNWQGFHVVYDEYGPQWVIAGDNVIGRNE